MTDDAEVSSSAFADALAIARYHIVFVAMAASVVFGWLISGTRRPWLAVVVGLDWFLINLMNRVTDLDEDLKNGIQGTERVARRKVPLTIFAWALMLGSFAATHVVWPELTVYRVAVQVIGLGYNYDIVPSLKGLTRFKELYFFKNFMSSVLFVLTCFVYGLAMDPSARTMSWEGIVTLVVFFIPFELTYEILYDLRDIEGDRAENVPTYPVVHGVTRARQIIDALLVLSASALVFGLARGTLGVLEGLMLAAPLIQFFVYRPRFQRGLIPADCIMITHLGTVLLLIYLAGTAGWLAAGLPENIYLVARM